MSPLLLAWTASERYLQVRISDLIEGDGEEIFRGFELRYRLGRGNKSENYLIQRKGKW